MPGLVSEYGDLAATATAEWYEQVRPGAGFTARTVAPASISDIERDVRYHAEHLFGDRPEDVLDALSGAVQRHIAYSSRETVARNVSLDPSQPRFARVPTGARTCAWCEMLASRGWVYYSRETAGAIKKFHDHDDCQIVPEWDAENAHLEGYDPDAMYDRYQQARDKLAADGNTAPTDREIASKLRHLFPDKYTDGAWPAKKTLATPDGPAVLTGKKINHLLDGDGVGKGGGHLSGVAQLGETEFPPHWDANKIIDAIERVVADPRRVNRTKQPNIYVAVVDNVVVEVKVAWRKNGTGRVTTAYPRSGDGVIRNTRNGRIDLPLDLGIFGPAE
ncbi:EndoU domain-containing protein [Microbacterium halotolerans]|uniref:VG15 protein n=1 Tax=Microbacterium halotolerans TaxID=246613 RepID=UPI0013C2CA4A|nr:EndoU domain-containing protein [Microbacterium halotolerans]